MEKRLEFQETLTVAQFKAKHGVDTIKVGKSKNGKLMFQAGGILGACRSGDLPTKPMFSLVRGEATEQNPDAKPFWLLHQESEALISVITEL